MKLLKNIKDRGTDILDYIRIHQVQLFISTQGCASGKLKHVKLCPQHLVYIFDVPENICTSLYPSRRNLIFLIQMANYVLLPNRTDVKEKCK